MRIYCNDCKWSRRLGYVVYGKVVYGKWCERECRHKSNWGLAYSPTKKYYKRREAICVLNMENNCKNYKRRWWKFWIKQK